MLESTSTPVSPVTSYWRATGLESAVRTDRRLSTPDNRADIVRCVEYKGSLLSPQRYDANLGYSHIGTAHVATRSPYVISTGPHRPEYTARVCLELEVLKTPPEPIDLVIACSVDFERFTGRGVKSNPDVSKVTLPPIKSCLKKPKPEFSSSFSLPSMELKEESKSNSVIEEVNKEWNKAYDSPETDSMLNKIMI